MLIYLIGSLRNDKVPVIAQALRAHGFRVFDDWYAAGPDADDHWKAYEQFRGHTYEEALDGIAAKHVFDHDQSWLDACDVAVLVRPAGRSGHLELGYVIGQGKPGYVLLEEGDDRWDVMYRFTNGVYSDLDKLVEVLR